MPIDIEQARVNMVENQIRPWEVLDPRVLEVLGSVRREDFVPARHRALAFADMMLPIGHGETMLKPVVEGRLLQALNLAGHEHVLEIGTGTGFLTACLACLAADVTSLEIHADLAETARARIAGAGFRNVQVKVADALAGYRSAVPADVVVVGGAMHALTDAVRDLVAPGGRMFAFIGESPAIEARLLTRSGPAHWQEESLFDTDIGYLRNAEPPRRFTL
ncbi:protein-L-isoaspartate O-methyltransferase family protein [Dokdonella sp.]|uniref:protein-L-isoaspartate O-methyltransferase family protein n=1 Tax=Dokdonella sp. TaxID=2291710 RepID=UPI0031C443D2|nr:protein-L-isoaspartate O-methyltransferase [Dokdonella sp.]